MPHREEYTWALLLLHFCTFGMYTVNVLSISNQQGVTMEKQMLSARQNTFNWNLTSFQNYRMSLAIWAHICHPLQMNTRRLNPSQRPVLDLPTPERDRKLSWRRWQVTYGDGMYEAYSVYSLLIVWRSGVVCMYARCYQWYWSLLLQFIYRRYAVRFIRCFGWDA